MIRNENIFKRFKRYKSQFHAHNEQINIRYKLVEIKYILSHYIFIW